MQINNIAGTQKVICIKTLSYAIILYKGMQCRIYRIMEG
jgi:hypothetical protein